MTAMTLTNCQPCVQPRVRPCVGVSLPPGYLNGLDDQLECHWRCLLGPPAVGLRLLREAGAESVELRMIRPGMSADAVRRAVGVVLEAGLQITLHGLLHPEGSHPADAGAFPLWEVAEEIGRMHGSTVVTLHARYVLEGSDEEQLSEETVVALRELLAESHQRNAPFRYALEINKTKAKIDPSFTWKGVESMVASVDDAALGICWDFGHAHYNFLKGLIPLEPPEGFLRRVIHTHIHDLGPQAQTHWPLGCEEGGVQVEESCRRLIEAGYTGVFNLELEPNRFGSGAEIRERILASVNRLAVAAAATPPPSSRQPRGLSSPRL